MGTQSRITDILARKYGVRKATQPEDDQLTIYRALGADKTAGGTKKIVV